MIRLSPRLLVLIPILLAASAAWGQQQLEYAIVVHGGAGSQPKGAKAEQRKAGIRKAMLHGRKILADGGAALDAVEQVIRRLEDDPQFNAGKGAVLNDPGGHELDASIMDGKTKRCGAVAGVTTVKNPISLARLVMTETRHVLLGGAGADQFAKQQGVDLVDPNYFRTEAAVREWEQVRAKRQKAASKGTVGCAALDRRGNLAAGTSTGGLTNKKFGRIGDSPIVGAGTYADNATCAVSCTGVGEEYIRNAIAYDISAQMKYGNVSLQEAVRRAMRQTLKPGNGGIIAVSRSGVIVTDFTTAGMARASADSTGRVFVGLAPAEQNSDSRDK